MKGREYGLDFYSPAFVSKLIPPVGVSVEGAANASRDWELRFTFIEKTITLILFRYSSVLSTLTYHCLYLQLTSA